MTDVSLDQGFEFTNIFDFEGQSVDPYSALWLILRCASMLPSAVDSVWFSAGFDSGLFSTVPDLILCCAQQCWVCFSCAVLYIQCQILICALLNSAGPDSAELYNTVKCQVWFCALLNCAVFYSNWSDSVLCSAVQDLILAIHILQWQD